LALDLEERADHRQRFPRPLGLGAEGLVEVAPGVRDAAHFDDRAVREDAGGIGAEHGLAERVLAHRLDDGPRERGELVVPAADGRAREFDAVARVDPFEPVEGLVVLPAAHDRVGEQAGPGEPALDRQLGRLGNQHRGGAVADAVLGHELRPDHPHDDGGGRAPLEDFAHLLADPLEVLEALALPVERDELDLHPREVLGERLAARGLPPLVLADLVGFGARGRRLLAEQQLEEGFHFQ
jgi:hypothetical protein